MSKDKLGQEKTSLNQGGNCDAKYHIRFFAEKYFVGLKSVCCDKCDKMIEAKVTLCPRREMEGLVDGC